MTGGHKAFTHLPKMENREAHIQRENTQQDYYILSWDTWHTISSQPFASHHKNKFTNPPWNPSVREEWLWRLKTILLFTLSICSSCTTPCGSGAAGPQDKLRSVLRIQAILCKVLPGSKVISPAEGMMWPRLAHQTEGSCHLSDGILGLLSTYVETMVVIWRLLNFENPQVFVFSLEY